MMEIKIKVFDGCPSNCEQEINTFLEKNNATPISLTSQDLKDWYPDGRVCNQWTETTLIYQVKGENK